ncbi:MAG: DegQ family serine endoprotease [Verrucomicrobiae bacterium]|nr:DegQ family serine endoprotease [Verrucomicrobiae bacterium]
MKTFRKSERLSSGARCKLFATFFVLLLGAQWFAPASVRYKIDDSPLDRSSQATSYAPLVNKVAPSVVNIYSTKVIRVRPLPFPFFDDPFFRRFFGDDELERFRQPRTQRAQNLGSGVIVTEDGYILTNTHVVEGADEIKVALADGKREYTAKIVGTDPQTDVAVLKIDAKDLPAITLGDSDKLEVGDVVLAIGNPFGVGQTVTKGIVSAKRRGGFGLLEYEDFIQTDAAINPGNSGGALVDTKGRLVGINTFIVSRSGGSQGIGFAIPINLARSVMDRLIKDGKVSRGYLGVNIQSVDADIAKEFNVPEGVGAIVADVHPNTPAEDAGLKPGDVIIEFDGKSVKDSRHLQFMVAETPPKKKVTLKIIRDGKQMTLTATLGERPSDLMARFGAPHEYDEPGLTVLEGVQLAELDARARKQFEIPEHVKGALVAEVETGAPAFGAGLRPGHVIVEINRKPVENLSDARQFLREAKGEKILLRVWSRGGSHYIVVPRRTARD